MASGQQQFGHQRRLAAHLVSAAACAGLVLALSACGGGSSTVNAQPSVSRNPALNAYYCSHGALYKLCQHTASPVAAPAAESVDGGGVLYHLSAFKLVDSAGYTATATLARSDVSEAAAGMVNGADTLGSGCSNDVDPQTTAVVPFRLTLKNTSQGFNFQPSVVLLPYASPAEGADSDPHLHIESTIGGGDCWPDNSQNMAGDSFSPANPLTPGSSASIDGFFVITGYYSPSAPRGDKSLIQDAVIDVSTGNLSTNIADATNATKPPGARFWMAAFDPAGDGGCIVAGNCGDGVVVP